MPQASLMKRIARSPLIMGGDLTKLDDFTLSLLTNDEVLAVDQKGRNAHEVFNRDGLIAWMSDAPNSPDTFIALFNTRDAIAGTKVEPITVSLADFGFTKAVQIRDLWGKKDLGEFTEKFTASIPAHGCALYRVSTIQK